MEEKEIAGDCKHKISSRESRYDAELTTEIGVACINLIKVATRQNPSTVMLKGAKRPTTH